MILLYILLSIVRASNGLLNLLVYYFYIFLVFRDVNMKSIISALTENISEIKQAYCNIYK